MQTPFPSLLTSVGAHGGCSTVLAADAQCAPGTRAQGPDVQLQEAPGEPLPAWAIISGEFILRPAHILDQEVALEF